MIARRRVAFFRLCALLRAVEADLDDLVAVRRLNLEVLKLVLHDEANIRRHRGVAKELNRRLKTGRPDKTGARALRRQIKRSEAAVERYLDQIYIWKCFGDGLACAYLSSFNLKPAFFDTASPAPKPDAGFLSGKAGLKNELLLLNSALDHKVPAVLCDLTTMVRYGDVCLLGGADPVPLEAKSREKLNQRGHRQASRLAELEQFLKEDFAEGYRGLPSMRRMSLETPVVDHIPALNDCIAQARSGGFHTVSPEPGLTYVAVYDGKALRFDTLFSRTSIVFLLNSDKTDRNWAPYFPFTRSIRDPKHLYDFIVGDLTLMVILDSHVLCERLAQPGWRASLLQDELSAILLEKLDGRGTLAISRQYISRVGFEFLSLSWLADHEMQAIRTIEQDFSDGKGTLVDLASLTTLFEDVPRLHHHENPAPPSA